ncbi:MAG: dihydrolipoamide acetyltransferase family protein [Planctomycetota bacterium]|nr:dihydrolipoamide acetyltransferase family protein [Planctomycetota bacterium]
MSIEITMPRLSDTMETGTIIKWEIAEGDVVSAGDVIADVETDKATMELQVFDDGTVARILVPEGQTTDVGTIIAILAEDDEDSTKVGTESGGASSAPESQTKATSSDTTSAPPASELEAPVPTREAPAPRSNGKMKVSPVARHLADEHSVDLRHVEGTGPGGRIIKRDILKAIDAGAETQAAVPPSSITPIEPVSVATPVKSRTAAMPLVPASMGSMLQEQIIPVSNIRQIIAKRLIESKTTVPHYQVTCAFDMDPLLEMRQQLNEQLVAQQVKLSVNDFLVKCCAVAMYEHPFFNASWEGEQIRIHGEINIGIAISLPPEKGGGLVVGVIRHADQKSLRAISSETRYLAEKARGKGLSLEEMSGSTFTISNLGMFGVEHFTAIINPPNSAILAVGAAIQKPVVKQGELVVGREMSATLSSDHRVIDGAMAAQYLASLRQYIENPASLLV